MDNVTEYQNLIELLKKTLEFYANEENYVEKPMNDGLMSMMEMDDGSQAKFALKKIKEFGEYKQESIEDFLKDVEDNLETNQDVDDLYKKLNMLKKLSDEKES